MTTLIPTRPYLLIVVFPGPSITQDLPQNCIVWIQTMNLNQGLHPSSFRQPYCQGSVCYTGHSRGRWWDLYTQWIWNGGSHTLEERRSIWNPSRTLVQERGTVLEWRTEPYFRVWDGFLSLKSPSQSTLPRPQQDRRLWVKYSRNLDLSRLNACISHVLPWFLQPCLGWGECGGKATTSVIVLQGALVFCFELLLLETVLITTTIHLIKSNLWVEKFFSFGWKFEKVGFIMA